MSKNKTNRTLIIVLVILLAAVIVNQVIKSQKGERTFKSDLVEFSADEVTSLSIFSEENNQEEITLTRNGDDWKVTSNGVEYSADSDMASNMANDLSMLKADRLIANNKDKWEEFNVTDTSGVRVVARDEKDELCDVIIGRFSYDQTSRKASTFVRLNGEKEVYSVEGYLSMLFNRDVNGFRNKSLFRGNQNDITKLSFQYPGDSTFTLSKLENGWMLGDLPADSAATAQYLSGISYLVGSEFIDGFDPAGIGLETFTLTMEGNNMSSVVLTAFKNEDGLSVIHSNLNPTSYLNAESGGLFDKVYKGLAHFVKQE